MLEISKLEREGFICKGNNNDLLDECIRMCNNHQQYPQKAKKAPSMPAETRPIARKKKKTTLPPTPVPETMKEESLDNKRGEEYNDNNMPPPLMGRQDNESSDDKSDDNVSVSSSVRRSRAQRNQGQYGESDNEPEKEEPDQDENSIVSKASEEGIGDGKFDLSQLDETIKTNKDGNEPINKVKKMKSTQQTWESLVKFFAGASILAIMRTFSCTM
jgi:hypothetical protein